MLFLLALNLFALVSGEPLLRPAFCQRCTARHYSEIPMLVASCTEITLRDIALPSNTSLDLTQLRPHSVVTFEGKTTFAFTNSSSFRPISVSGAHVRLTSAPGAIIDGNGQAYWDGLGSNGGVPKPTVFIAINNVTNNSIVENLHIQNWPTHGFSISNSRDLTIRNLFLDNRAGDAPNNRSAGLAAAHNTDGFDIGTCERCSISSCVVFNQDDCVGIISGNNITVSHMFCLGGHGLSIGSVGGKAHNNVTNVLFESSAIISSQNGARIKTNFNTTGFIANITYSNLLLSNISINGIDVQQDYLNGGATGIATNGVVIQNVSFKDIVGTMNAQKSLTRDYFVLCGNNSCSDIKFQGVSITGGRKKSSSNIPVVDYKGVVAHLS